MVEYRIGADWYPARVVACDDFELKIHSRKLQTRHVDMRYDRRLVRPQGENYERFRARLQNMGLDVLLMEKDGNCLFRAVAYLVYGGYRMHERVRRECYDYIVGYFV